MDTLSLIKDLAIIIIAAKFFAIFARKLKAPQVAGEIIAGLVIGPSFLNIVETNDFLSAIAEIGVILLMFSAGLETDIQQLKKSGLKATLIACAGVAVPLVAGTILFMLFYGFAEPGTEQFIRGVFIGTILTATSVSITVQALREMGKISTEVGTTIMSAAIIDDVLGIIVLTGVIGMKDPSSSIVMIVVKTLLFFAITGGGGYLVYQVMKKIDYRHPHTRRIPIMGMALAFALSYIADTYFGVADITGAFCAGIILSSLDDSEYINRKMDINSYMLFGPVFFCSIGLQTNLWELDTTILLFSAAFVVVGMAMKVVGCGAVAKICGYNGSDSVKIGVGMMTRGEVALIVAQRGLKAGLMDSSFFTSVILLIIVSSIVTPIMLKALYARDRRKKRAAAGADPA